MIRCPAARPRYGTGPPCRARCGRTSRPPKRFAAVVGDGEIPTGNVNTVRVFGIDGDAREIPRARTQIVHARPGIAVVFALEHTAARAAIVALVAARAAEVALDHGVDDFRILRKYGDADPPRGFRNAFGQFLPRAARVVGAV